MQRLVRKRIWQSIGSRSRISCNPQTTAPFRIGSRLLSSSSPNDDDCNSNKQSHASFPFARPRVRTQQTDLARSYAPSRMQKSNNYAGPVDWDQIGRQIDLFVEQAKCGAIPQGVVSNRVRDMLVQLVSMPNHQPMRGQMADVLLEVAERDLEWANPRQDLTRILRAKIYQLAIEGWVGKNDRIAPSQTRDVALSKGEKLLWKMLAKPKDSHNNRFFSMNVEKNMRNIHDAFATVVYALTKGEEPMLSSGSTRRIEKLIGSLYQLWDDTSIPLGPSTAAIDPILYFHFKLQQPDEAYQILKWTMQQSNNQFLKPSPHGVTTVVSTFAKCGKVEEARMLIEQMLQQKSRLPRPNVVTFNALLDGIGKQGRKTAGDDAEDVLQWMEGIGTAPNTVSYSTAIVAWVASQGPDAPERSEAILRHMIDRQIAGSSSQAPNEFTFAAVINAWANSGRPDAAAKAADVMQLMRDLSNENYMQPEKMVAAFDSLIVTLARGSDEDAGDKALSLLNEMSKREISPTATTYSAVITAISRNDPQKAVDFFEELEMKFISGEQSVVLDASCFNAALHAYALLNHPAAPEQAWGLLHRMNSFGSDNTAPTTSTFNIVIKILAKSTLEDACFRADQLLKEMEESPTSEVKPNAITYSSCISAWGRTRDADRYDQMRELLARMEKSYRNGNPEAKPNVIPYNTLFIACLCETEDRQRSLKCVLDTLTDLRQKEEVEPNRNTYSLVLRAIGLNTTPGYERDALVSQEFLHCIKDGLVCPNVLQELEKTAPNVYQAQVSAVGVAGDSIPVEWQRNVQAAYARRNLVPGP